MVIGWFNSAFCKEALFAMQHGEVGESFSLLNRAWCVLTIRVFAVLQGALLMLASASQNEGRAWRRCIGNGIHREVEVIAYA
jgi:hypothetical protein